MFDQVRGFAGQYAVALGLIMLLFGSGCAQRGPGGADSHANDLVTESDEPEARKRARLRLELAAGYFEQGQTNVALDELKQSLAADSTFADAYSLRGLIYMRLNEPRLADDSFRRAVALAPANGDVAHNYAWFLCQQTRYPESFAQFDRALAIASYAGKSKSLLGLGLCQARAGRRIDAEHNLIKAYEFEPGNPIVAYNLSNLLYQRGDFKRAQFYIRRLNNSELANAETLWLGIRVERKMEDRDAMRQLSDQLRRRFASSREAGLLDRGSFDD